MADQRGRYVWPVGDEQSPPISGQTCLQEVLDKAVRAERRPIGGLEYAGTAGRDGRSDLVRGREQRPAVRRDRRDHPDGHAKRERESVLRTGEPGYGYQVALDAGGLLGTLLEHR